MYLDGTPRKPGSRDLRRKTKRMDKKCVCVCVLEEGEKWRGTSQERRLGGAS